ncbi:MAG TPA: hypothetical protein VFS25_21765, partial [Chitinophaga sp.]|uniref:hypothetical protein n=1 Tax=Chitinophaga sp. TaxID=1869181 RepID=UPI002DBABE70
HNYLPIPFWRKLPMAAGNFFFHCAYSLRAGIASLYCNDERTGVKGISIATVFSIFKEMLNFLGNSKIRS